MNLTNLWGGSRTSPKYQGQTAPPYEILNKRLNSLTGVSKAWISIPCSQEQVTDVLMTVLSRGMRFDAFPEQARIYILMQLGDIAPSLDVRLVDQNGYCGSALHHAMTLSLPIATEVVKLYKKFGESHLINEIDSRQRRVLDYYCDQLGAIQVNSITDFLVREGAKTTFQLQSDLIAYMWEKWPAYQASIGQASATGSAFNSFDPNFNVWIAGQTPHPLSCAIPAARLYTRMRTPWEARSWGKELKTELVLGHEKLTMTDREEVGFFLKFSTTQPELVKVTEFRFSGTVTPEVADLSAQIIAALPQLTALSLDNLDYSNHERLAQQNIGTEGAGALAQVLKVNTSLKSLVLKGGYLGPEGSRVLATALQSNSSLTALTLKRNAIGLQGAHALATMLEANKTLKKLEIGEHNIPLEGVQRIADAIENNTSLTALEVDHSLRDPVEGFMALLDMLSRNETLLQVRHGSLYYLKVGAEELADEERLLAYNQMLADDRLAADSRSQSFDVISLIARQMIRAGKAKKIAPATSTAAVDEFWMLARKDLV